MRQWKGFQKEAVSVFLETASQSQRILLSDPLTELFV